MQQEIVQQYQTETLKIQEKAKDIEKKSEQEKSALVSEVNTVLDNLKKDAEIFEVQKDTTNQAKLLSFQPELEYVRSQIITGNREPVSVVEEQSASSTDKEEKTLWEKMKDWTKERADAVSSKETREKEPGKNAFRAIAGV